MTDTDLAEIRARAEAATPGPWESRPGSPWGGGLGGNKPAEVLTTVKLPATGIPFTARQFGSPFISTEILDVSDAEFIAHAREDIPFLLAEVSALREVIEKATVFVDDADEAERSKSSLIDRIWIDSLRAILAPAVASPETEGDTK